MTAIAEIVGCYLPYLWLKKDGSAWLLIPAAISRVYAAYGGVYVVTAFTLTGMAVIAAGWKA
ncbi:hypothetical protein EST55_11970 [Idiomarina sp. 29L]|nr:hypothetical protein EST55_11970 [Idiomarina sp. 29L]